MQGTCRFCEQESDLQESHIIPKFIYAHFKDTSATGKIRQSEQVNKRVQDGIKLYWLCRPCETMFGNWEKYFSETILHPLHGNQTPIHYNNKFLKFCASISWRVSKYLIEKNHISHFSDEIMSKLNNALNTWKKFLLDEEPNPGIYEHHFYNFTGEIKIANAKASENIHRYLQRTVDFDVINWGESSIIVYAKFPSLLLIGYVNTKNLKKEKATKIHVRKGMLIRQNLTLSNQLWDYILTKSKKTADAKQRISAKQKEQIDKDYRGLTHEEIVASGTFQSMLNDTALAEEVDVSQDNTPPID